MSRETRKSTRLQLVQECTAASSGETRKSTRLQQVQECTAASSDSTSKKKTADNSDSDNSIESFSPYEHADIEEDLNNIETNYEKPTELFLENDVDGKNLYSVSNGAVKKNSTFEKANTCRNLQFSQTPTTPVKKDFPANSKSNKKNVKRVLSSGSEVEDDAGNEGSCSNTSEDEKSYNNKENEEKKKKNRVNIKEDAKSLPLRRGRSKASNDYHLQANEYFAIQSEKSITSNSTLSKLRNRQLDEEKLQKLLADDSYISKAHQKGIKKLTEIIQTRYMEWIQLMEEGFTVLLYGLGSKRKLINDFHKQLIPDEPTLIVNGFFPSLTVKEILDNIITELLGLETVSNHNECFDIIQKTMQKHPDECIYLLIHNLDGGMLRSNKAQDMLSRLACIPNMHVLASVDHINAPLIWDNVKRSRYNFYWMDATTFLPYEAETSYEGSLLVQKSGALALLSLQNVFASLTKNAKSVYIVLAKYQLENISNNYAGMAFKDLYRASREAFLVSSDQALRSQLTEFIDHKLVKTKRNVDGIEYLIIPLDKSLLKQFLDQNNEM